MRQRRRRVLSLALLYGATAAKASSNQNDWPDPPPPPPESHDMIPEPFPDSNNPEDPATWNSNYDNYDYENNDPYYPTQPYDPYNDNPPPPPPPPNQPQSKDPLPQYNPIHYNFPKEKTVTEKRGFFGRKKKLPEPDGNNNNDKPLLDDDDIPNTIWPEPELEPESEPYNRRRNDREPEFASPRRDVITRYQSTLRGKLSLAMSSGVAGSMLGAFLGKSLLNNPLPLSALFCGIFLVCTLFRDPYGELVRALGMALLLALQRTTFIRRRYPTWRHIRATVGLSPRRNFPPTLNPWNYQPRDERDPEFKMLYVLVAMMFVGSTCGGSIPLIPTWMGSLAGAGFFALTTTQQRAVGDLARTMGMRVVALCEEMLGINTELEILSKGAVVSGKIFDKIMIMDRKHRVKDRLVSGATFLYRQVNAQVNRVQEDINRDDNENDNAEDRRGARRPPRRDDDFRRRPDPRDDRRRRDNDRGGRRPPDDFRARDDRGDSRRGNGRGFGDRRAPGDDRPFR